MNISKFYTDLKNIINVTSDIIASINVTRIRTIPASLFLFIKFLTALRPFSTAPAKNSIGKRTPLLLLKNKIITKQQSNSNFRKEYIEKEVEADDEIKIIRTKKFGIKPMYPEDACVQMELLGHNFFVFFNAETEQVNVVYKRKGNTYGLIEPEF